MARFDSPTFYECVQLHERAWGDDTYYKRPTLEAIMESPVVVFWSPAPGKMKKDERYTVTLHPNLAEVHKHVSRLVLRSAVHIPDKRIAYLFVEKKRVVIKGIKLLLETEDKPPRR